MWESQAAFNMTFLVLTPVIVLLVSFYANRNRREKALLSVSRHIRKFEIEATLNSLKKVVTDNFTRPKLDLEGVEEKLIEFRTAQTKYNEAAERARFALQSHKEQCAEAAQRAAEIHAAALESAKSRSFSQVFMDAKLASIGSVVAGGCIELVQNQLKANLGDLLALGVKLGVAVERARRDEPFEVKGLILYMPLKKYMQVITIVMDGKCNDENVIKSLHESFFKATRKAGGFEAVIAGIPSGKEFSKLGKQLQTLGYTLEEGDAKRFALATLPVATGKKSLDTSNVRSAVRTWDSLIKSAPKPASKSKSAKKKLATATLPKKALASHSPTAEASIPPPQEQTEEKEEEKEAPEEPEPKVEDEEEVEAEPSDEAPPAQEEPVQEEQKVEAKKPEPVKQQPKKVAAALVDPELEDAPKEEIKQAARPAKTEEKPKAVEKKQPVVEGKKKEAPVEEKKPEPTPAPVVPKTLEVEEPAKKVWRPTLKGTLGARRAAKAR